MFITLCINVIDGNAVPHHRVVAHIYARQHRRHLGPRFLNPVSSSAEPGSKRNTSGFWGSLYYNYRKEAPYSNY